VTALTEQRHLNALFAKSHQAVEDFLKGEPEGLYSQAFAPFRSTVFSFTGLAFTTAGEAKDIRSKAISRLDNTEGNEAAHKAAVACINQHYARERSRLLNQG